MASNGSSGANGAAPAHRFDPNFTKLVVDTMGPKTTERNRVVLGALIRHLHDFTREVELTIPEWLAAVAFVNDVGRTWVESGSTRNEAHRLSDILGLESLVDEIAHKVVTEQGDLDPTSTAILGPFWSPDAPFRGLGDVIYQDGIPPEGRAVKMHGVVTDMTTGKPIPNAVFDIWQASANGKYDFQDPQNQTANNLRGKVRTGDDGRYWLYCLHPTAYSLPQDGPSWKLLQMMDRHPMRPAHIHIMVSADGYQTCTTQLYPKDDRWLSTDTVFAVKDDLVVDFTPLEGDSKASLELEYNIVLPPKGYNKPKA